VGSKLSRGAFAATFFLASLAALGVESLDLGDIWRGVTAVQEPDRKVIWSLVAVLAFISAVLAWLALVGPADHGAHAGTNQAGDQNYPWWQYSGAWVALFTVALTFSTVLLWMSTRAAVGVAERTLTELERPWVFVVDSDAVGIFSNPPFVLLKLCNYGRTVGEVRLLKGGIRYTAAKDLEIATIPIPSIESSEIGSVVPPDGMPHTATLTFPPPKETNARAFVEAGEYKLILRAELHYTGLLKEPGVTALCLMYDARKRRFTRCGGEEYNYAK